MTVHSLLRDLRHTAQLLRKVDTIILQAEKQERKNTLYTLPPNNRPGQVFNETFEAHPARSILHTILADMSCAANNVSLLITVLSGQALHFQGIDSYSSLTEDQFTKVVHTFFNEQRNGMSGLEGLLRETGDEQVTDLELFDTYRVIGCQSVEMWGVSVHRNVNGVCKEAERFSQQVLEDAATWAGVYPG